MKNRVLAAVLSIIMVICLLPGAVFADETGVELSEANFPDKTLREELEYYDTDEDGILSEYEQYGPTVLELSGKSITTLKGIELLLNAAFCQQLRAYEHRRSARKPHDTQLQKQ